MKSLFKGKHLRGAIALASIALLTFISGRGMAAQECPLPDDMEKVKFIMNYRITASMGTQQVKFTVLIPRTIALRQEVLGIDYSLQPARVFDDGNNRYAEFVIDRPQSVTNLSIGLNMALYRYDASCVKEQAFGVLADRSAFLNAEQYLQKDSPVIQNIVKEINGTDELDTVRKLFAYEASRIKYAGYVPEDVGAEGVLARGTGDCSDFSDLLVTLCRAKNIPARSVDGILINYGNDTPLHNWSEFYSARYGWIPVDPLLTSLGKVGFDRLKPQYIYLSDKRNDPNLNNYHFYSCSYSGGMVRIKDSYRLIREPEAPLSTVAAVK